MIGTFQNIKIITKWIIGFCCVQEIKQNKKSEVQEETRRTLDLFNLITLQIMQEYSGININVRLVFKRFSHL